MAFNSCTIYIFISDFQKYYVQAHIYFLKETYKNIFTLMDYSDSVDLNYAKCISLLF